MAEKSLEVIMNEQKDVLFKALSSSVPFELRQRMYQYADALNRAMDFDLKDKDNDEFSDGETVLEKFIRQLVSGLFGSGTGYFFTVKDRVAVCSKWLKENNLAYNVTRKVSGFVGDVQTGDKINQFIAQLDHADKGRIFWNGREQSLCINGEISEENEAALRKMVPNLEEYFDFEVTRQ